MVVLGIGGIGINVIKGERMVGEEKIIGVEINKEKVEMERKLGMKELIKKREIGNEKVVKEIKDMKDGGEEY